MDSEDRGEHFNCVLLKQTVGVVEEMLQLYTTTKIKNDEVSERKVINARIQLICSFIFPISDGEGPER